MSNLFSGTYARGDGAAALDADAWLRAMLELEVALAQANAELGSISEAAAEAIAAAAQPQAFDTQTLAAAGADHATVVIPLVARLRELVGPEHAPAVHVGATSQDIVDSAMMLVAKRSLAVTLSDATTASAAARALAKWNGRNQIIGRTLLQQAVPLSFGQKALRWSQAIGQAQQGLAAASRSLPVQLGGPVGEAEPQLTRLVAKRLGLEVPESCWHTNRVPVAQLATAAAILAGALGKVARDVTLLAQTEVAEASEGVPGRGGSSAMAHKQNPVAAVSILACSKRTPGLAATVLACMEQEHERAAGAWQAEWGTVTELLALTASAAAWSADLLGHLKLDARQMTHNLEATSR